MADIRFRIAQAIQGVRGEIRWKPNSAMRHLEKRQRQKHLPIEAALTDYEHIITSVLHDGAGQVYLFWYAGTPYVSVVASVQARPWLVMFSLERLMETAFVLDMPHYLEQPGFEKIGGLDEVLRHESGTITCRL